MIKQADERDISIIEDILLDSVSWMSERGLQNQWNESNVRWSNLSRNYKITDFYIAYQNETPAACMALTNYDPINWTGMPEGESFYLHKLAVKRLFAGKGYSKELIDYAKDVALKFCVSTIRLNCNKHRIKLRAIYEKEGFKCVEEKKYENYETALYVYTVN